jgi:hypothetical protein
MTGAIEIRVAPDGMPPVRCMDCHAVIKPGQEFYTLPWPNRGGFDNHHYSCPEPQRSDPSKRHVQGSR